MIKVSMCLSDLPKEKITEGKYGKKYINLILDKRKNEGKFGETHTLYVAQTEEERKEKTDKVYCGSGKEYIWENKTEQQEQPEPQRVEPITKTGGVETDLPF